MLAQRLSGRPDIDTSISAEASDARMVGRMRLVLAVSAVLALSIDPKGLSGLGGPAGLVFGSYVVHSLVVYLLSRFNQPAANSRLMHWLDVLWFTLIVLFTDGINSFFFLFFFFAILTSALRWGFVEGARVSMASAVLFMACGLGTSDAQDLARLLLKTTFLLTLGYMCAHWGGSKVELKRRLALLRDVSRLSNPRFGPDHTIASVLEKTRQFFGADSCILVLHDRDTASYTLRSVSAAGNAQPLRGQRIDEDMALPLMDSLRNQILAYCRPALALFERSAIYDEATNRWRKDRSHATQRLAELLEARSFISAPLKSRKGEGRIHVLSSQPRLRKPDALFLNQLAAQAFPVIDNIELLDRMASHAAAQERQKIALDIHDNAIQPYIGLKMGLSALRHQAAPDNPLIENLDKLGAMATQVIDDLRRYAGSVKDGAAGQKEQKVLLSTLRQQALQVRDFYGIDFAVEVDDGVCVNDRLMAEVVQIVREGLSNVCKHTLAQHGAIRVQYQADRLSIDIENESAGAAFAAFTPRSISERAGALGGSASVLPSTGGGTLVHVEIPV